MFVLSGLLFVLALVALPAGLAQDGLALVYLSIAASLASIACLVIGVRRRPPPLDPLPAADPGLPPVR